jgi:general secretion pathway protein E
MFTPATLPETLSRAALEAGAGDPAACAKAVGEAIDAQGSPVTAALDAGGIDETRFLHSLADQLGMPWMGDRIQPIQGPLREQFPARVALRHHLMPAQYEENGPLWVLTYDPFNQLARQVVAQTCPPGVRWGIAGRRQILDSLRQGYGVGAETFEELLAGRLDPDAALDIKQETTVLDMDDSEASVVKFVNQIIREALNERATDIHVEPLENDLRIRYRIDGVLHETPVPPQIKLLQASVISRLKSWRT